MEKIKLLTVRARSHDKGISLYFQSDVLEDFFKSLHHAAGHSTESYTHNPSWGSVAAYQPGGQDVFSGYRAWGLKLYEKNKPNMSFLLAVGLTKGVTFHLNNKIIVNEAILDQYMSDFNKELARLYNEYLKSVSYEDEIEL